MLGLKAGSYGIESKIFFKGLLLISACICIEILNCWYALIRNNNTFAQSLNVIA